MRYPVFHVVFPALVLAAGCAKHGGSSAGAPAPPPQPAPDAAAASIATPTPPPAPAAPVAPAASADFAACGTVWTLAVDPAVRVLDGALSGGIAGLLLDDAGAPRLLLVTGDGLDTKAVTLPEDAAAGAPDAGATAGPLVGAVTSYGDRFLTAYGHVTPDGLALRVRAVMPDGRILPIAAPGHPGAAGDPVLQTGAVPDGAVPDVLLHTFTEGAVLAVSWKPAEPAGTSTVLTSTGGPLPPGRLGWSLAPAPPGSCAAWLVAADWADNEAYPYIGPFDGAALALDDSGQPIRIGSGPGSTPVQFADGWVPAAGERVWSAPGMLLRPAPGEAATRMLSYDARGAVRERVELPAGTAPVALSRDARTYLVRDAAGALSICRVGAPAVLPRIVNASAALAHPGDGASACGR